MKQHQPHYGDKQLARNLRRNATAAETILWQYLRSNALGLKFRRQYPLNHYVLDFYCVRLRLCIEIDGDVHNTMMKNEHDKLRTEYLNEMGITVLRYDNDVVFKNVDAILLSIQNYAKNVKFMPGWHVNEFIE